MVRNMPARRVLRGPMSMMSGAATLSRTWLVCALAASCAAQAPAALGQTAPIRAQADAASASASLGQCVTAAVQGERSATFVGEMTAIAGSVRMAMRIDIQERTTGEALFHTVSAPGLGVWRRSEPGVKAYKYRNRVTNLPAPASYRAAVHFRWLGARGRLVGSAERHTAACRQPAPVPAPSLPGTASTADAPPPVG